MLRRITGRLAPRLLAAQSGQIPCGLYAFRRLNYTPPHTHRGEKKESDNFEFKFRESSDPLVRPQIIQKSEEVHYTFHNPPSSNHFRVHVDAILDCISGGKKVKVTFKNPTCEFLQEAKYLLHLLVEDNFDSLKILQDIDEDFEGCLEFVLGPRNVAKKKPPTKERSETILTEEILQEDFEPRSKADVE